MLLLLQSNSSSSAENIVANNALYRVGDAVQGDFGGQGRWYDAQVLSVAADGSTCALRYSDGDEETQVPLSRVRRPLSQPAQYGAGDKVEGDFQGAGTWFAGRIVCESVQKRAGGGDRCYDVLYEDGEEEKGVPVKRLRLVERAAEAPAITGSEDADRYDANEVTSESGCFIAFSDDYNFF